MSVSYNLLAADTRQTLQQLTIFPHSFDLASTLAVLTPMTEEEVQNALGELLVLDLLITEPQSGRYV
jgi:hypothetical protein